LSDPERSRGLAFSLQRFFGAPFWRSPTFWIIVAVNLTLVLLYLWSRGGATTDVRIEAIGNTFRAYVDDKLIAEGELPARAEGGIGFRLAGEDDIPSLPGPSGLDSVRVTDAGTGEVLFEDSFSSPSSLWRVEGEDWRSRSGVFAPRDGGFVTTGPQPWRNYVLEAKLRNVTTADVYVRTQDSLNTVAFAMRPYQHYDSLLVLISEGLQSGAVGGAALELDRGQTVQSITAMLLKPYPIVLLLVLGAALLAFVARVSPAEWAFAQIGLGIHSVASWIVVVMAGTAVAVLWYILYVVGDAMPHVPDDVVYIWMSKMFASFQLWAEPPPVTDSFSMFYPPFQHVIDDRYFGPYPFGHPLFLAIGQLLRVPWLVPPLVGAGSVVLIYLVGKRVYDSATVGLIAAALLLFSPFFQMTASNFMSHSTTAFVILACLYLWTLPTKHRLPAMLFGGIFLGLLFNTRPLTAVTLMPAIGLFMGYELLRSGPRWRQLLAEDVVFAGGALLMLGAYFLYNHQLTGSYTESPYEYSGALQPDTFGFGGSHSVALGLQNQQVLLAMLLLVANGFPLFIGLAFAALPFVLGTRHPWDYFLGVCGLALAGTMMYFPDEALMHGPRYWYEAMPFLILLSARGFVRLREAGSAAGEWLARSFHWRETVSSAGFMGFAMTSLAAGLIMFSVWGWMLERRDAFPPIEFVPSKISELEGFNNVDPRLLDRADELDLDNALVLVEPCSPWWCYGSVFWTNNVERDGNVVWARRLGTADDLTLLDFYRGRNLYLADYGAGTVRATSEEEIGGMIPTPSEPQPTEQPGGPTPTPGPPDATAAERDALRKTHLEQIRQALVEYGERHGAYPTTGGQAQTLCVYVDLDVGCALTEVLPDIPQEPKGNSPADGYWYVSDGTFFVVVAQLEAEEEQAGQCPERAGRPASDREQYCVEGELPAGG
jgi:hypothetical protein